MSENGLFETEISPSSYITTVLALKLLPFQVIPIKSEKLAE